MLVELYIFAFVIVAYGTFITLAIVGFSRLNRHINATISSSNFFISIVISARNEAENIETCLYQIIKQNFPKHLFEIILIDDASEDDTFEISERILSNSDMTYQILKQEVHQGKKKNLASAIEKTKGSIIITSDADVVYRHPNWLLTISNYFTTYSPKMLIMPIDYETQSGFLETFQIIENIALTGVTAGYNGIRNSFMCNGANLAFTKESYDSVSGYKSHLHISSGEDVFLLEQIKKINPHAIHYVLLRELIVKTKPLHNLKSLFNQRLRWAYKAKYNSNQLNLFAGFIIVTANLLFLALFVAILKKSVIIPYLSIFVLAKLVFDFLLLFLASDFLGRLKYMWWFVPFECVYWVYAFLIGLTSLLFKPSWKGKKIT